MCHLKTGTQIAGVNEGAVRRIFAYKRKAVTGSKVKSKESCPYS
jgi:hypothetical protein